ncbi:hypothetical protein 1 [Beihai tombus-like virus 7]|uniref:hypothetical protein 1 n=1 Tax=Beihai tombus-like virus 7 TaxID=1922728 RepID=UPI00090C75C1|nr:hypothetical protein 1 [Beihai tombus-like virus 7]APG76110.1 hypothetical protein 1 [Beihai tombus-like virus 7]APG76152.1 hypothetical protein 1 [Beihai tombus-like virus 7]
MNSEQCLQMLKELLSSLVDLLHQLKDLLQPKLISACGAVSNAITASKPVISRGIVLCATGFKQILTGTITYGTPVVTHSVQITREAIKIAYNAILAKIMAIMPKTASVIAFVSHMAFAGVRVTITELLQWLKEIIRCFLAPESEIFERIIDDVNLCAHQTVGQQLLTVVTSSPLRALQWITMMPGAMMSSAVFGLRAILMRLMSGPSNTLGPAAELLRPPAGQVFTLWFSHMFGAVLATNLLVLPALPPDLSESEKLRILRVTGLVALLLTPTLVYAQCRLEQ